MADKKQEFKQLEELEQARLDPIKINLGWRGHIPGYKRRVVGQINRQIEREFSDPGQQDSEIEYANRLAFEREEETAVEKQTEEIKNEGASFGSPSIIKYFVLFFLLAVPNDAVDALELTGLLAILAWFISFFLSISSILISWFLNNEQARANNYLTKVEEYKKTAIHLTKIAYRVAKFSRKLKFARRVTKNPTFKIVAGAVAEMIPFISIFPWSSISVILAYLDERRSYTNAKKSGEEIYEQPSETVPEMV